MTKLLDSIRFLGMLRDYDVIDQASYRHELRNLCGIEEEVPVHPLELPLDTDAYHTNRFREIWEKEQRLEFEGCNT